MANVSWLSWRFILGKRSVCSYAKYFVNRNPRNLEQLAIEEKRKGWCLQFPSVTFYNQLTYEQTNQHTVGRLVHHSGNVVLQASTWEPRIRSQLYKPTDVCAAYNIGRVLADRCLKAGFCCVHFDRSLYAANSEKVDAFVRAFTEAGVLIGEPDTVRRMAQPGIDYDRFDGKPPPRPAKRKFDWKDLVSSVSQELPEIIDETHQMEHIRGR